MESSPEIVARKKALQSDLENVIERSFKKARGNYRLSLGLMSVALGCSVAAGIFGVFARMPRIAGGLALVPPLIAYVVANLKVDGKSRWHYRRIVALHALRSRLLYELPESPGVDDIAAVSSSWTTLNEKTQKEWDDNLALDWSGLSKKPASL